VQQVTRLVDNTYGMVVLGWPQIIVREGALREQPVSDLRLPTEWNHIEAAIGLARGRPLMFLRERSVAERGLLDAAALGWYVHEIDGSDPGWALQADEPLRRWKIEVEKFRSRTVSLDGLRVLRLLAARPASSRRMEAQAIRRALGDVDAQRLRRVLGKLVDHRLVASTAYEGGAANDYQVTPHGRSFLEGFQMGAPLNHV
jgi:hypothetical protein